MKQYMQKIALLALVFGASGLCAEEAANQEISMSDRAGCRSSTIRSIAERNEFYQEDPYVRGEDEDRGECEKEKPCNKGVKRRSAAQTARGE